MGICFGFGHWELGSLCLTARGVVGSGVLGAGWLYCRFFSFTYIFC